MASIFADTSAFFTGVVDGLMHNALGGIILGAIVMFLYIRWLKPKEVDMNEVIFKKEFEATAEQMKLPKPKYLALCSFPYSAKEDKENPIHHLQHNIMGMVVGINVVGVRSSVKTVVKLSQQFNETELHNFLMENESIIDKDKFWIVFAVKRRMGGMLFFTRYTNDLIYVKPDQIIDVNSKDDKIRVRGFGIQPQGYYSLITDEAINLNVKQLQLDKVDVMFDELGLSTMARMGNYVTKAMEMDSGTRKEAALKGLDILQPPKSGEVKT